jgi:hypothetical protein
MPSAAPRLDPPRSTRSLLIAAWGAGGVALIVGQAIARLTPIALRPIRTGMLAGWQWAVLIAWVLFQLYAEGYRGFWRAFSPRVVARAFHLARRPRALHVLLAPLFCMGFFHATRRRLIVSWLFTLGLIGLILLVHQLPQPWRGIVDAGVVAGLVVGLAGMAVHFARAAAGRPMPVPADVPEPPAVV